MGSYNVDDEQEDKKIRMDEWENTNLTELYKQKNILITRLNALIEMKANEHFCRQVQQGIDKIDAYINKHTGGGGTFL